MNIADLEFFFSKVDDQNWTVLFEDGDRYSVGVLDHWGRTDNGDYEIYVNFADCIGVSAALQRVWDGDEFTEVFWSSVGAKEPVGKLYTIGQVESVYDEDNSYYLYQQ